MPAWCVRIEMPPAPRSNERLSGTATHAAANAVKYLQSDDRFVGLRRRTARAGTACDSPHRAGGGFLGVARVQTTLTLDLNTEEGQVNAELLYQERCATCHDAGRAPPRSQIAANTPDEMLEALDTGFMAAVALFMTHEQKLALARHLSNER